MALQQTKLAKYSLSNFRADFEKNPGAWIRTIQIIITRLMHVTFKTLNEHLDLGRELFKTVCCRYNIIFSVFQVHIKFS